MYTSNAKLINSQNLVFPYLSKQFGGFQAVMSRLKVIKHIEKHCELM